MKEAESDPMDIILDNDQFMNDIKQDIEKKPEKKIPRSTFEYYYQHIFPYKYFYKWLSNEKTDIFERREFTFTLEGDIYVRFLCFKNEIELKSEILRAVPIKIDIGAIYNTLPKYHNSTMDLGTNGKGFVPVAKEIVFDIDMTDYDDVRTCCKDAQVCNKCWCYMIIAYRILSSILEQDFGFKHNIWIFSGRRGIHCWVCDERAKKLTNEGRSSVANYIKIKNSNAKTGNIHVLRDNIHPSYERSISIIEEYFESRIIPEQKIFASENVRDLFILYFREHFKQRNNLQEIEQELRQTMEISLEQNNAQVNLNIWHKLLYMLEKYEQEQNTNKKSFKLKHSKTELLKKNFMLALTYPRLDINVSKHLNHLLKAPFCVHPKTGLLSVPLTEDDILNFRMENIPEVEDTITSANENKPSKFTHFLNNFKKFVDGLNSGR